MKYGMNIGVIAVMLMLALAVLPAMGDKTINTNEFSFGDEANYANLTTNEVVIGPSHFNNEANLFVYDNATYDYVTFKVTGDQDPATGHYLSDVGIDLGNNGRYEYRFSGDSVGQWGNQTFIMNPDMDSLKKADIIPTPEGDTYYLKIPSKATVKSAQINLTHVDQAVNKVVTIPSSSKYAVSYMYHYSTYGYSYFYYGPYYSSTYNHYYAYPLADDYSSASGYPMSNGYLEWDHTDPNLMVPPGADLLNYQLSWPVYLYRYGSTSFPGYSGTYHHGERTYSVYPVTSSWPSTTTYLTTPTQYGGMTAEYNDFKSINPTWASTPADSYLVDAYHGTSSGYYYNTDVLYDLSGILEDWNSETIENNGIMVAMSDTPYCSGFPQSTGYTYYSGNANYYLFYYRGYMICPAASSSYDAYKPKLLISYSLDSKGPWVDIGADNSKEWTASGKYSGSTIVSGWQATVNQYLASHFPDEVDDYGNEFTYVPIKIGADTAGKLTASDIKVLYDYKATVYYNPSSVNLLSELSSLVPDSGEGYSLLEINVTSSTEGKLKFSDLKLRGMKPNYAPTVLEIQDIETHEGVIEDELMVVSDHFFDVDQDKTTLFYKIQKNSQRDHVGLYLWKAEDNRVMMGIDTSKDENWYGDVTCQISATDEFGKNVWSNQFMIHVQPVNDLPYILMEVPDIQTLEGVDPILLEYSAPEGRSIAVGKEVFMIRSGGEPYFADIEGQFIHLDFEFLGPDMMPVNLDWSNEDGHKIYRGADNKVYLTVLPPEYTDDPDNYILIFGSDPDFSSNEGPFYLRIYASDNPYDLYNETMVTFKFTVDALNDPPEVNPIPDITMNEDGTFVSTFDFVSEYISDKDNELEDLEISFMSQDKNVIVSLDEDNHLVIDLGLDFNGVIPVTVEVSDGVDIGTGSFNVRVRSINDPPSLSVTNLFDGQLISGMYLIKGTANDVEKGLKAVEVALVAKGDTLYLDDWQATQGLYVWQYLMDTRNYEEGTYDIMLRAFDGRDFSPIKTYEITLEGSIHVVSSDPPEVTITTPLLGEQSNTVTVTGMVSDDSGLVSFVEYRIDGGIWRKASLMSGTEWKLVIDTRSLSNEQHNLSVRAFDEKLYSNIVFRKFDVFNLDSDGDGIPNDIEIMLLMDPFNNLDGTMDFDGDGFSNQEELMVYNTDPFSGFSTPDSDDKGQLLDTWALVFIVAAIICAAVIIGLFILNISLERNIHYWRNDLGKRRMERKPKTLLQKIVEIAPTYAASTRVPEGPTLPGQSYSETDLLPPMQEEN